GRDFEGTARSGRGLFENQADFLACQRLLLGVGIFRPLEVTREVEQIEHLALGKIRDLEVAASLEIERHDILSRSSLRRKVSKQGPAGWGRSCSARRRGLGRVPGSQSL